MIPTLYYCYDAYCGWCFGFSPVIRRIEEEFAGRMAFETLSGGMIPRTSAKPVSVIADFIRNGYKQVEELTGIRFGEEFLWHVRNPDLSDWYPHSEKAAVALCILKEYHPDKSIAFAAALQHALYAEGRDLTDDEAYRHLLPMFDIPETEFYEFLSSEEFIGRAHQEFSMVSQLRVNGFPAVLLQTGELSFQLMARGYTGFDTLYQRIEKGLAMMCGLQKS
jgi:putative protein-disulfide isomerase